MNDVIPLIGQYLPPKILLKLSYSCRAARHWLTYELAIKSILCFGTKHGIHSLHILMKLSREQKIWLPSPDRLLKLCTGRRCERGNLIFINEETLPGNDDSDAEESSEDDLRPKKKKAKVSAVSAIRRPSVEHGSKCTGEVHHVRPDYGMLLCWTCTQNLTFMIKCGVMKYERMMPSSLGDHKHVAAWAKSGNKVYVWDRLIKSKYPKGNGEYVGPVVNMALVNAIHASKGKTRFGTKIVDLSAELLDSFVPAYMKSKQRSYSPDDRYMVKLFAWFDKFDPHAVEFRKVEAVKKEEAKKVRQGARDDKVEKLIEKLIEQIQKEEFELASDGFGKDGDCMEVDGDEGNWAGKLQRTKLFQQLTACFKPAPSGVKASHLKNLSAYLSEVFSKVPISVLEGEDSRIFRHENPALNRIIDILVKASPKANRVERIPYLVLHAAVLMYLPPVAGKLLEFWERNWLGCVAHAVTKASYDEPQRLISHYFFEEIDESSIADHKKAFRDLYKKILEIQKRVEESIKGGAEKGGSEKKRQKSSNDPGVLDLEKALEFAKALKMELPKHVDNLSVSTENVLGSLDENYRLYETICPQALRFVRKSKLSEVSTNNEIGGVHMPDLGTVYVCALEAGLNLKEKLEETLTTREANTEGWQLKAFLLFVESVRNGASLLRRIFATVTISLLDFDPKGSLPATNELERLGDQHFVFKLNERVFFSVCLMYLPFRIVRFLPAAGEKLLFRIAKTTVERVWNRKINNARWSNQFKSALNDAFNQHNQPFKTLQSFARGDDAVPDSAAFLENKPSAIEKAVRLGKFLFCKVPEMRPALEASFANLEALIQNHQAEVERLATVSLGFQSLRFIKDDANTIAEWRLLSSRSEELLLSTFLRGFELGSDAFEVKIVTESSVLAREIIAGISVLIPPPVKYSSSSSSSCSYRSSYRSWGGGWRRSRNYWRRRNSYRYGLYDCEYDAY
ncbi:hypothetical protein HDU97_002444 [Phlyctochytrium planicorne]|nr:hypothetical protein HDU97_002444 [Phlyctochytrium planicorne]